MRLPALALAQRGLTLDARGHASYALRSLLVLFMLLALWNVSQMGRFWGAPGLHLLRWMIFTNFFFIALIGISTFATVITEEKENQTLGLLKLAGLSGMSILLGKSAGQLLAMVLLLLVQMPLLLLAITLGGVSRHQIAAAWMLLLAHLLFVYALALLGSVVAPRSGIAARATGLLLLGYYLLPVLGIRITAGSGKSLLFELSSGLQETWAFSGLQATIATGYRAPLFTSPVIVTLTIALVLFATAGLLFAPCTRTDAAAAPARMVVADWMLGRVRATGRPRGHPVLWKDFQFGLGGPVGLLLRCVCYGLLLLVLGLIMGRSGGKEDFGRVTMIVMAIVLMVELGNQAGRVFHEEIKWRTLPMLMLLPIPLRSWSYAKVIARSAVALPAATAFAVGAAMAPETFGFLCRQILAGAWWYLLGLAVVTLHLTAWLSLRLQRGAFAVAILLVFVGHTIFGMMLRYLPFESVTTIGVCLLMIAWFMHPAIGSVLRRKAAE